METQQGLDTSTWQAFGKSASEARRPAKDYVQADEVNDAEKLYMADNAKEPVGTNNADDRNEGNEAAGAEEADWDGEGHEADAGANEGLPDDQG